MRAMSHHDDATDWGTFDITLCYSNEDRSTFLPNPGAIYVLYWWGDYTIMI